MQPVRFGTIIHIRKTQAVKEPFLPIFAKSEGPRKQLDEAVQKLRQQYDTQVVHAAEISDTERLVVVGTEDLQVLMENESRVAKGAANITAAKERMVAVRILMADQADKIIDVDA